MKIGFKTIILCLAAGILCASCGRRYVNEVYVQRGTELIDSIYKYYSTGNCELLNETYPLNPEQAVTYLVAEDTVTKQRVAFLWPTSGMFTGMNAMLKATGDWKYGKMLTSKVIEGLGNYYDDARTPYAYQSYVMADGPSDRYYDDNVWLAMDFLESFKLTGDSSYLKTSEQIWDFLMSGVDTVLGGGMYWCEQNKGSKNTCSNAPASVLAFQLFEATDDSSYFKTGQQLYEWTKENLQDPEDMVYWDNISVDGNVGKAKYPYNTGQMIQSAALQYKLTGDKKFLEEAQMTARNGMDYFTVDFTDPAGKQMKLFKRTDLWFLAVMMRGYVELYQLDGDPQYLRIYADNIDQAWNNVRDAQGFISKDLSGAQNDTYKWLLDQGAMVEMIGNLARVDLTGK